MKKKTYWLLTSLVTLLPMLVGLVLWDQLPDRLPTHFGLDGNADGWSGRSFGVFGVPLLMLLFHWVCYYATLLDKQNRGHNEKVLNLIGLLFPAMSVLFDVLIYSTALEMDVNMPRLLLPLLGLFLLLVGNWLPKIRQNSTLGIKLPWTLYNEENWNRTHRVGGYTWVLGGLVFVVMGFVPERLLLWLMPANLVLMVGVPTLYSWNLARKQRRSGTYTESRVSQNLKKHPVIQAVSLILVAAILIGVGAMMFTGDIEASVTEDILTIEADFWEDLTVSLDTIDTLEFRPEGVSGIREWGYGSARLLLGLFQNEEFGSYTRYTYTGDGGCIVLHAGDRTLVLGLETAADTLALYEQLQQALMDP